MAVRLQRRLPSGRKSRRGQTLLSVSRLSLINSLVDSRAGVDLGVDIGAGSSRWEFDYCDVEGCAGPGAYAISLRSASCVRCRSETGLRVRVGVRRLGLCTATSRSCRCTCTSTGARQLRECSANGGNTRCASIRLGDFLASSVFFGDRGTVDGGRCRHAPVAADPACG